MKRLFLAALLAAIASAAHAQTTTRTTFTAVDGVRMEEGTAPALLVTGVLEGATAATEERFRFATGVDLAECRRWALLAMAKPGQYLLSFRATFVATAVPPYWYGRDCKLERVRP